MIALHTPVLVGLTAEPGTVVARNGCGSEYFVRFADGRVRRFVAGWVRPAIVQAPARGLRLVVDNERRA